MKLKSINPRLSSLWNESDITGLARSRRCCSKIACAVAIGACLALPVVANAAAISFPLNFCSLVNTNADGTASSADDGASVVITGGNTGTGLSGTTDLVAVAAAPVTIAFQFSFASLDAPAFDFAGFLVNGLFTEVADSSGQSGSASFSALSGDTFGFRVGTADNTGEPGIFTVSDVVVEESAVPEPSTQLLMVGAACTAALFCALRRVLEKRL